MTPPLNRWLNVDVVTLLETLTQYFFVILSAPLFAGILAKLKAMVESRNGPSIFQPYYDLLKLFNKVTIIPRGSGGFFKYMPYVLFGIYSLIALIIPVLVPVPIYLTASGDFLSGAILFSLATFLKTAAAMNSGSNYVALGASRAMSFNFLSEGTLITVFIAVSLLTATNNPYTTITSLTSNSLENISLAHIFSTLAFFMLFFLRNR
jgi:formate hydrogenlyase subunit 4